MVHLFAIACLAGLAGLCRIVHGTWWSASALFASVWAIFLALHKIAAPDFIFTFPAGWAVIGYLLAFAVGDFLQHLAGSSRVSGVPPDRMRHVAINPRLKTVILVMGGASLVGAVWYSTLFTSFYGSVQGLLTAGWTIRGDIAAGAIAVPFYIRMLLLIAYPCYCLSLAHWVLGGPLWLIVLPCCSLFMMAASQAGRAGLLILCLLFFFAFLARERIRFGRLRRMRVVGIGCVVLALIVGIFTAGAAYRAQSFSIDRPDDSQLVGAKSYAFGAISSFASYLENRRPEEPGLGAWSFASLFQALNVRSYETGYYVDYLPISKLDPQLTSNVYTIFRSAIDDFGLGGAAIYFMILGVLFGAFFRRALELKAGAIAQAIIAAGFLAYSVFAPLSQHTALLLCFVIPPIVLHRYVKTGWVPRLGIPGGPGKSPKRHAEMARHGPRENAN